ncbi:hypothetical protein [Methylocapsa acidiphila]|uniref:hypothetical protein n=1 Tax=Methylocapsa acidiphila TaxID=133552 RepID=UPI00047A5A6D|nr:hypothetical protein [Methylocapsa acidiphila]
MILVIAGRGRAFFQGAVIRASLLAFLNKQHHVGDAIAVIDRPTGLPRLPDFDDHTAEPKYVADGNIGFAIPCVDRFSPNPPGCSEAGRP